MAAILSVSFTVSMWQYVNVSLYILLSQKTMTDV